jgi:Uma2 family endonuclease
MGAVTARELIPTGPWTVEDLDDFPEGTGVRYELIDGALLVSAEPSLQHQRVCLRLLLLLDEAAPADLEVFLPIDVRLSPFRQIAPDITVVRRQDAGDRRLVGTPVLVVEVQSPSTRAVDLTLKRQALQDAGVPSYWLVDPDTLTIRVLELEAGEYVERAVVAGEGAVQLTHPFPIRLAAANLRR